MHSFIFLRQDVSDVITQVKSEFNPVSVCFFYIYILDISLVNLVYDRICAGDRMNYSIMFVTLSGQ